MTNPDLAVPHDILHFHSHKDCTICREVKQRRNYSRPVPEQFRHTANKIHKKTDIDQSKMKKDKKGVQKVFLDMDEGDVYDRKSISNKKSKVIGSYNNNSEFKKI